MMCGAFENFTLGYVPYTDDDIASAAGLRGAGRS